MFKPVDTAFDVPKLEHEVIDFWREAEIEQKYLCRNDRSETRWSFLDGPITANGQMGVHHAWGRTYKDLWQRYHTMLGHKQRYQNGFDCQGLWVEVTVERELGFTSKRDIERYGIAEFVRKCKESVFKNAAIQTAQSQRLGYFMDWDNSYYTLSDENNYTIWGFLKLCHERGWLYKGTDVMPWCVRCGTGLSEHEINTTEYLELTHTAVYARLPLLDRPDEYLLVWTTTPWTLAGNVAVAVNPGNDPQTDEPVRYVRVRQGDAVYYLAKSMLDVLGTDHKDCEVLDEMSGADLVGLRYSGPFDELPIAAGIEHRVIPWSDVSATEGTGLVHIAPGSGKEDFALGKEFELRTVAPMDENGYYVPGFGWLTGRRVTEVADDIVENLREKGLLFRVHRYTHRYPTCWRCGTELVFRLVDEWFISMDELRSHMMDATRRITWIPSWGLERELDWLRNMADWMISKKRYWGLALPIFECSCGHVDVIGSREELFERAVAGLDDLESPHRPWLDAVRIRCSACGDLVARITDVGNPWLDAGIVPFSTLHYATDPDYWREWFPADFITESFPGQFRNWFYSMIAQSAAIVDANPFTTVLGYALLRDENGREMHKSWGNLIPFDEAADRVGADIMRWLFCGCDPEHNLNFGYTLLNGVKSRLLTLWNTYSFFVTYANIDDFDPAAHSVPLAERSLLDRWVVARFNEVVAAVRQSLDRFDAMTATRSIETFIEDLSTWYVRRSRRRFWKSGAAQEDADKLAAYVTLYEVLRGLTTLLAPFVPFVSEHMYANLVRAVDPAASESVHLCDYPVVDEAAIDRDLLSAMDVARRVVSLGRAAREQAEIKVRQPLAEMYVKLPDDGAVAALDGVRDIVLDELNVKQLELADAAADFVDYRIRPNLRVLGPRYGKEVRTIGAALAEIPPSEVASRVGEGQAVIVEFDSRSVALAPDEILVEAVRKPGFTAAGEAGYLVALNTTITPELRREGWARDVIRAVNELRKSAGFNLDDRIRLQYQATPGFEEAMRTHGDWIARETLATSVTSGDAVGDHQTELNLDGERIQLAVERVERSVET